MNSGASLTLKPITAGEPGENIPPFSPRDDRACLIGRSSEADWMVPVASVSRRHASIARKAGCWFVTDLASRHGTTLNNRAIEPQVPAAIGHGDVLAFGSWQCRVTSGADPHAMVTVFTPAPRGSVTAIGPESLGGVAQRGLEILMDLTGKLNSARDRRGVAAHAVEAIRRATGCRRTVVVEPTSETELAVIASATGEVPSVSRSMIDQAARLGMVELVVGEASAGAQAQSILDLGIRSAICAPISVDNAPVAFITVDTRDTEGVVPKDAAAFCKSVAQLVSLTFARISATDLAERHRQLHADLEAARRAQELLSPQKHGGFGRLSYRFESIPGRIVAGDLFDIFPIGDGRTAFFLGDVSGKGVGAAMLMAACQSQLRTRLLARAGGGGLADAINAVNSDLFRRTEQSKFITLVAGVVDPERGCVEVVDAGHGLCVLCQPGQAPALVESASGMPLGVADDGEYTPQRLPMPPGARLILFSDGALEQTGPAGDQFGMDRVLRAVAGDGPDCTVVETLVEAVRQHAGGPLADDLTVACLTAG